MAASSPPPYIYISNKTHQHQLHQLCLGNDMIRLMICRSGGPPESQVVIGKVCSIPFECGDNWTFCWSILEADIGSVINGRIDSDATGEYPEFSFVAKAKSKYTIVGTFTSGLTTIAECVLMLEPRNYDKESEEELHGDIDRWYANRWNYMDAHIGDDLSTME